MQPARLLNLAAALAVALGCAQAIGQNPATLPLGVAVAADRRLFDLQAEARSSGRGLWADPNAVEPWVWRQVHPKGDR
ncbi:hypothetical protein M622_18525 [Thauera terpenica 58Eu]|uniref:TNase-like domain-containing protein n=1 Tax=Thauera terpenica 58Eu TaxID=1348657 RepID=S9ZLK5_9RHOO|nr:hypothetical protein [Thauera terpenica]EPZ14387.1 hypothetical protein M622_18525 [Thauera terpenica 58Eu]